MKVEDRNVVGIEYTLKDAAGEVLDASADGPPLYFIQGMGTLVPGLEKKILGRALGESFEVAVSAAEGYGAYNDQLKRRVPRADLKNIGDVQPGTMLQARTPEGMSVVTVTDVTDSEIELDGNHPMAGKDLFFSVRIAEIRNATREELTHGHVHGPDGHHHH